MLLGIAYVIAPDFKGGSYIGDFEEQGVLDDSLKLSLGSGYWLRLVYILIHLDIGNYDSRSLSYFVTTDELIILRYHDQIKDEKALSDDD